MKSTRLKSYNSNETLGTNGILDEDTHRMIDALSTDTEPESPFSNKQIEFNDVIGFFFDQLPPGLKVLK